MSQVRPAYLLRQQSIAVWDEALQCVQLHKKGEAPRKLWDNGGTDHRHDVRALIPGCDDKLLSIVFEWTTTPRAPVVVQVADGSLVQGLEGLSSSTISLAFSTATPSAANSGGKLFLAALSAEGTLLTFELFNRNGKFFAFGKKKIELPSADLVCSGPFLAVVIDDRIGLYYWHDLNKVVEKDVVTKGLFARSVLWLMDQTTEVDTNETIFRCVALADVGSVALTFSQPAATQVQCERLDFATFESCVCNARVLAFVEDGLLKLYCGGVPSVIDSMPPDARLCGFSSCDDGDDGFYIWRRETKEIEFLVVQDQLLQLFVELEDETLAEQNIAQRLSDPRVKDVSSRRRLARFIVTRDLLDGYVASTALAELLACSERCQLVLQHLDSSIATTLDELRDEFCFVIFESASYAKPTRGRFTTIASDLVAGFFELFCAIEGNTISQLDVFLTGTLLFLRSMIEDLSRELRQLRRSQAPQTKPDPLNEMPITLDERKKLHEQLRSLADTLDESYIDRSEVIRVSLLAVVCKEHCFLLGPPGTGKSAVARDVCGAFSADGKYSTVFEVVLHSGSTLDDVIGPYDLGALDDNVAVRTRTGKLAGDGTLFAFLDECFKAQKDLLTVLLSAMNERVFYDGTRQVNIPLHTMFGASNEIPKSADMGALLDRFLFRAMVPSITESMKMWKVSFGQKKPSTTASGQTASVLSPVMLQRIAKQVKDPPISDPVIGALLFKIETFLKELEVVRTRVNSQAHVMGGGIWTDRRRKQMRKILNVSRFANDRDAIDPLDLLCLIPASWNDPQQIEAVEDFFLKLLRTHRSSLVGIAREESNRLLDQHLFLSASLRTRLRAAEAKPSNFLAMSNSEKQQLLLLSEMNTLKRDEETVMGALGREQSRLNTNCVSRARREEMGRGLAALLPSSFCPATYLTLNGSEIGNALQGATPREVAVFAALHFYRCGCRKNLRYIDPTKAAVAINETFDSSTIPLPSTVDQWARHCVDLRETLTVYFRFPERTTEWLEGTAKGLTTIARVESTLLIPAVVPICMWLQDHYLRKMEPRWKQVLPTLLILVALAKHRDAFPERSRRIYDNLVSLAVVAVNAVAGKWPCAYCHDWFPVSETSVVEFFQHQTSCGARPYVCPYRCGQRLTIVMSDTRRIAQHETTDCALFPVQCEACDAKFTRSKLSAHAAVCSKTAVPCAKCATLVAREHMEAHQKKLCTMRLVKCDYCNESQTAENLPLHHDTDCPKVPVVCTVCTTMVPREELLNAHKSKCPMEIIKCALCMEKHPRCKQTEHATYCKNEQVECPKCKTFKGIRDKMNEHLAQDCKEVEVSCGEPCKFTCRRGSLPEHRKTCEKGTEKCAYCGNDVVRHMMPTHHTKHCDKNFVSCKECSIQVAKKSLESHLSNDCEKVTWTCDKCNETMNRKKKKPFHSKRCPNEMVTCQACHKNPVTCLRKDAKAVMNDHRCDAVEAHRVFVESASMPGHEDKGELTPGRTNTFICDVVRRSTLWNGKVRFAKDEGYLFYWLAFHYDKKETETNQRVYECEPQTIDLRSYTAHGSKINNWYGTAKTNVKVEQQLLNFRTNDVFRFGDKVGFPFLKNLFGDLKVSATVKATVRYLKYKRDIKFELNAAYSWPPAVQVVACWFGIVPESGEPRALPEHADEARRVLEESILLNSGRIVIMEPLEELFGVERAPGLKYVLAFRTSWLGEEEDHQAYSMTAFHFP